MKMSAGRSWLHALVDRCLLCMGFGWFVAALLSLFALGAYLLRGPEPFQANRTSIGLAVLTYFAGATLAGVVVGLTLPLARWRIGAVIVGMLAAVPFYAAIRFAVDGFTPWTMKDTFVILLTSLFVGAPVGLSYYSLFHD